MSPPSHRCPGKLSRQGELRELTPVFREYLDCDPGYPVVFVDHYRRENHNNREERWHNPPRWAPALIWRFFSALRAIE